MNDHPASGQDRNVTAKREFIAFWQSSRDADGLQPAALEVCPYPGLRSFRPTEADLFYGRDSQIRDLRDLLAKHNIIVVLGGSGSGKSSLVRAGLVPKLNSTTPIPERVGAWYVVEFRPKLDPVSELFDAILAQLIMPILAVPQTGDDDGLPGQGRAIDPLTERRRRIGVLRAAFDLECELDAPDTEFQDKCRDRLRDILLEGNVVDIAALFDFVEERLRKLDEGLSRGAVAGAPNLLLLIDQFEEVFKPKVEAAGRDMVMSLINSIHAYKPHNLFLIVTMRSEELHRCSEFLGITEVVNSSLYLVDLIGGRNIEQAIVGPARRVLKSWDLDPGDPETGPYTRRSLARLLQVFDEGRDVLPHPADQLPLMQHLLPLIWDQAIERWQAAEDHSAPLQIDLEDLQAVPGWTAPERPLTGTLNAQADDVLRRAVDAGEKKAKEIGKDAIRELMRVAFCCLAQLDDRGNVVRDFATLDQMLAASGPCERSPQDREKYREVLRVAFDVFQRAALVNVGRSYDVNHEALIRGWKRYANWLKDARRRVDRLASVDRRISERRQAGQKAGVLAQLWKRGIDWILVENLQRADQIAGDETSKDLQDMLGPTSAFSEQWARQALARTDVAVSGTGAVACSVEARIGEVKKTIDNAILYRSGGRDRPRRIAMSFVGAMLIFVVGMIYFFLIATQQQALNDELKGLNDELKGLNEQAEQLNKQFRFFRLQAEATATPPDGLPRDLVEDREVYATLQVALTTAALDMAVGAAVDTLKAQRVIRGAADRPAPGAEQQPPAPQMPEATRVYRTSLRQLDRSTRNILSDVSVKIVDNASANPELAALDAAPADCAVTDPEMEVRYLVADEPESLGLALRAELSEGVRIIHMRPIRRVSSDEFRELESSNLRGRRLEPGVLVCLSKDANWFLIWRPLPEHQVAEPPVIQRVQWIRTARQPSGDDDWHAELKEGRLPQTRQTWANVETLSEEYQRLNSAVRDGGRVIDSFRSGSRAGFTIALGENKAALLWTSTGLVDPEAVETALPHKLVLCEFDTPETRSQTGGLAKVSRCEMGPISFDGIDHFLTADYQGCLRPETPAVCETAISLHYKPLDPERSSARVAFRHSSSRIVAAAVWDDSLWIKDTNDQVWRYLVGMKALQNLLVERWKGIGDPAKMAKASYSDSCKQLNCDKVRVPGWPGQ